MNIRKSIIVGVAVATLFPAAGAVLAGDNHRYGHQLMTPEERAEHQRTVRELGTQEAREAYRRKHHETMRARAAEQGVTLPEEPLTRGKAGGRAEGPRWNY